jgi:hypothetical protein
MKFVALVHANNGKKANLFMSNIIASRSTKGVLFEKIIKQTRQPVNIQIERDGHDQRG